MMPFTKFVKMNYFQEADLGRPPTPFEVFKRMHKKKDGSFVDKRSLDINVSFIS